MKKIILTIVILIVLFISLYSTILLIDRGIQEQAVDLSGFENVEQHLIKYNVEKGDLDYYIQVPGNIAGPEDSIKNIEVEHWGNNTFTILKDVGEFIELDESLYSLNNNVVNSKFNGVVSSISVDKTNAVIDILNFDDLYVEASLPEEEFGFISNENDISLLFGEKSYKGKLVYLEPFIVDKTFIVRIKLLDVLPLEKSKLINSKVEVVIVSAVAFNDGWLASRIDVARDL